MSTVLAPSDFELKVSVWRTAYDAPSRRESEAWSTDVARLLRQLPYVVLAGGSGGFDDSLALRATVNLPPGSLEIVRADVERIWRQEMGDVPKAALTFDLTADRLVFRFACVTSGDGLFSGRVVFIPKG